MKCKIRFRNFLAIITAFAMIFTGFMIPAMADDLELNPYITGSQISYKLPGETEWKTVNPDKDGKVTVPAGADGYQIGIIFKIPAGTLSEQDNTLTYQLPGDIKVHPSNGEIVESEDGTVTVLGTYDIDSSGQVILHYNQTAIENNQTADICNGEIRYDLDLSGTGSSGAPKDITTSIGQEPLVIHFKLEPDLSIVKNVNAPDQGTRLKYTLDVNSTNGTDGQDVTVVDTREPGPDGLVSLNGAQNIEVLNGNGETVTGWQETKTENGFEITGLPPLEAGGHYTITYDSSMTLTNGTGKVTANNSALAKSGNIESEPSQTSYTYTFSPDSLVQKDGAVQPDGRVKWSVVINSGHHDISGFTLNDLINDAPFSAKVSISPAVNGADQIDIPYTFPSGTTGTYTITYITNQQPLDGSTVNIVQLTPPESDNPATAVKSIPYTGQAILSQITKEAIKTEPGPNGTEIVSWNVTVDSGSDGYSGQVELSDLLYQKGMYFTLDQLKSLYATTEAQLEMMGNSISKMVVTNASGQSCLLNQASSDNHYIGFQIYTTHGFQYGQNLDITYQTTANIQEVKNEQMIINEIWLNADNLDSPMTIVGSWTWSDHYPTIHKLDATDPDGGSITKHKYSDTHRILKWEIPVTIPAKYNGTPFTVEDTLPDGLNLEKGPDKKAITDPVAVKIDGQSYPLDQASVSEQDDQPVSLEIVSDSIKVTNMATGAELPENAYSYVLSSENNGNGKILYKIAFTLPDQIPIKIQYAYKVNGSAGAMCTLSNSAHLDSITQGKMNSETRQQMRVSQSSVTSEEIGLTIFKTDQDNSRN